MKEKKYKLSDSRTNINGIYYYWIYALVDIPSIGVKIGDIGGFVESEANLSQMGNCWVKENARVSGNAYVGDNAYVFGNAIIKGNAQVYGNAMVCGDAIVMDDSSVYGNAIVMGNVIICGKDTSCGDYNNPNNGEKINNMVDDIIMESDKDILEYVIKGLTIPMELITKRNNYINIKASRV